MKFLKNIIGFSVLCWCGSALASNLCDSYAGYPQYAAEHPECFPGGATTSTVQIGATSFTQATAIFQSLASRNGGGAPGPVASLGNASGLAAGGASQSWNVWLSHNATTSSVRVNNGANRNDSDVGTTSMGGDYMLSPALTVGVSAAFDRTDGRSLAGGISHTNGYNIAPYLSYQISKTLALDVVAGLGKGEFSSGAIRADADRWFSAANLSYAQWIDRIQLTGKLGYLHGEEKYENSKNNGAVLAGSGAKNQVDQIRAGVRAGYWMDGVMPYAGLTYSTDVSRTSSLAAVDPLGRQAFVLVVGADFFSLASKITGGVAFQSEQGRTNSKNDVLMANINVRF